MGKRYIIITESEKERKKNEKLWILWFMSSELSRWHYRLLKRHSEKKHRRETTDIYWHRIENIYLFVYVSKKKIKTIIL